MMQTQTLRSVSARTRKIARTQLGLKFDRRYTYIANLSDLDPTKVFNWLREHECQLTWVPGCFHPYLSEKTA